VVFVVKMIFFYFLRKKYFSCFIKYCQINCPSGKGFELVPIKLAVIKHALISDIFFLLTLWKTFCLFFKNIILNTQFINYIFF
jgi:hypothetical protein